MDAEDTGRRHNISHGLLGGCDEAWPRVATEDGQCEDTPPVPRYVPVAKVETEQIRVRGLVKRRTVAARTMRTLLFLP
jgi:hypothetical protein